MWIETRNVELLVHICIFVMTCQTIVTCVDGIQPKSFPILRIDDTGRPIFKEMLAYFQKVDKNTEKLFVCLPICGRVQTKFINSTVKWWLAK